MGTHKLTLVLPARNRAGGTRAGVEMANHLLKRGHGVRLAVRRNASPPILSRRRVRRDVERFLRWTRGIGNDDWVCNFLGEVVDYRKLDEVPFARDEIVIAVGTFVVHDLNDLQADVRKMRWCVGLTQHDPERMKAAWSIRMPTVSSSPNLVPILESMSGEAVVGIVSLAINSKEYFLEQRPREGVGTVFSWSDKKAPEDAMAIFNRVAEKWPGVPHHVFGFAACPPGLRPHQYTQLPSVEVARELYNRCKVWVVASRTEGFCLPILEAMSCGAAVVCSDHDTASVLMKDQVNGCLVPVGDIDAFVDRIDLIMHDDALRTRLAERGLETARQYTWEAAADQMERMLEKVTALLRSPSACPA